MERGWYWKLFYHSVFILSERAGLFLLCLQESPLLGAIFTWRHHSDIDVTDVSLPKSLCPNRSQACRSRCLKTLPLQSKKSNQNNTENHQLSGIRPSLQEKKMEDHILPLCFIYGNLVGFAVQNASISMKFKSCTEEDKGHLLLNGIAFHFGIRVIGHSGIFASPFSQKVILKVDFS